ncbi:hypothetical protein CHUAL_004289 [Chamberlinius hualienensis]
MGVLRFGANLVRKVRRAGTELINKVPRTKSKENEKERSIKSSEMGECGDNQDNSSMGSGSFGHDSPDSSSETISQEVKEENNGDAADNVSFERRNSLRRPRQSKPNSVFYAKLQDESSITRESVSSEDIISLQDTQSQDSTAVFGDIESVTSNGSAEQSQSQIKNKSSQEELCGGSSRFSLGTPGTRRAVYYTEEHDNGVNHDATSNGGSPLHRSPSIGPKYGRLSDKAHILASPQNRAIRNTTSEYTISSATGSPVLPPRSSANSVTSSRDWNNKARDQYASLTELSRVSSPTSSIASKDSNLSQVPLVSSVKNPSYTSEQSDSELSNFNVNGSRAGSVIGRIKAHNALVDTGIDNAGSNHSNLNNSEGIGSSSPNYRVPISQNKSLHETTSPSLDSSPNVIHSPNLSLRSNNSNRNSSQSLSRTSSLLITNKSNHQLNNSLPKVSNDKNNSANGLPTQPNDTGASRTVDNSIWYEYGCV